MTKMHPREAFVPLAKTQLSIKISDYLNAREVDYVEGLRALTFEIRNILLDMATPVERAETFSELKDMIRAHQKEHGLTDIEVLQELFSYGQSELKYMLRHERHDSYVKPSGWA